MKAPPQKKINKKKQTKKHAHMHACVSIKGSRGSVGSRGKGIRESISTKSKSGSRARGSKKERKKHERKESLRQRRRHKQNQRQSNEWEQGRSCNGKSTGRGS